MTAATYVAGDKTQVGAKHLLILGDGFSRSQMFLSPDAEFSRLCDKVVKALQAEGWLGEGSKLCVWRANTYVTQDDPLMTDCAGASGGMPRTRFGTAYVTVDGICKCLYGSSVELLDAADNYNAPAGATGWDMYLVIVNSSAYGGYCSGNIAWSYAGEEMVGTMTAHELGHVLGLLDEYENPCSSKDSKGLPSLVEPNISSSVKYAPWWKGKEGSPTKYKNDCAAVSPDKAGVVAAFKGGNHTHYRYYRPASRCRMRCLPDSFCPVCSQHIRSQLYPQLATS